MSDKWEERFKRWGGPPSASEQEKCERAVAAVRKAIDASAALAVHRIAVIPQGSYRNRTNISQDSDVDLCVLCEDVYFLDLRHGLTKSDCGLVDATYSYAAFKNDVGNALVARFGGGAVNRGNKAFDVHANTYRIDADVVPCFRHVRYWRGSDGRILQVHGTELQPDRGPRIVNWPQQNYDNGVAKNSETRKRFKALVRILKHLRIEMKEAGVPEAGPIPSFLNECLAWNVPNEGFGADRYVENVRFAIAHLWQETRTDASCWEWGEINELKYLLRGGQAWTRSQVNAFLQAVWNYVGFN